jgi:4,5-dihydroxyphthalate decarboxylase
MLDTTPTVPEAYRDKVVRVFPDVANVQKDWYRRMGFNVAIHVIAVRQAAIDERPTLPEELCAAFDEAKSIAYLEMQNEWTIGLPLMRTYLDETRELFGDDPWPYGLNQNFNQLEKLLHYAHDQGFLGQRLSPEAIIHEQAGAYEFTARMPYGSRPGSPQIG